MASLIPLFVHLTRVQQNAHLVLDELQAESYWNSCYRQEQKASVVLAACPSSMRHHSSVLWDLSVYSVFLRKACWPWAPACLAPSRRPQKCAIWYLLPVPAWRWPLLSSINSHPPKAISHLTTLAIAPALRAQAHKELFATASGTPLPAGEIFQFLPETTSTMKRELWLCPSCLDAWTLAANMTHAASTPFPKHLCSPLLPHPELTMKSEAIPWHQEKPLTWSCIPTFSGKHPRLGCPLCPLPKLVVFPPSQRSWEWICPNHMSWRCPGDTISRNLGVSKPPSIQACALHNLQQCSWSRGV